MALLGIGDLEIKIEGVREGLILLVRLGGAMRGRYGSGTLQPAMGG